MSYCVIASADDDTCACFDLTDEQADFLAHLFAELNKHATSDWSGLVSIEKLTADICVQSLCGNKCNCLPPINLSEVVE